MAHPVSVAVPLRSYSDGATQTSHEVVLPASSYSDGSTQTFPHEAMVPASSYSDGSTQTSHEAVVPARSYSDGSIQTCPYEAMVPASSHLDGSIRPSRLRAHFNARLKARETSSSHPVIAISPIYHIEIIPICSISPGSPTEMRETEIDSELSQPPRKRTKTHEVTGLYDANGNLTLGPRNPPNPYVYYPDKAQERKKTRPKEKRKRSEMEEQQKVMGRKRAPVPSPDYLIEPVDESGPLVQGLSSEPRNRPEAENQPEAEQVPETPRARGWGITSFLPSAQTVSKFIPFSSRRTPSATTFAEGTLPDTPVPQSRRPPLNFDEPNPHPITFARQPNLHPELGTQTEPRQQKSGIPMAADPLVGRATEGPVKRRHERKPKNMLLTKAEAEERRKFKKQQAELKAQQEKVATEREEIRKEKERLYDERSKLQQQLEKTQMPGEKRARSPSPDVIPNPPGVSYGLDLDHFWHDHMSGEDEPDTPTRGPPAKKTRLSLSDNQVVGDPHTARPYTGSVFASPKPRTSPSTNVFDEQPMEEHTESNVIITPSGSKIYPNTFRVPSPGDSDSDEEDATADSSTPTKVAPTPATTSQPTSQTSTSLFKQPETNPVTSTPSVSPPKPMAPPPRPNPSHASLPPASSTSSRPLVDAVEKARQKALLHQPKTGSRLRESSRLSTSTVASEAGEDQSRIQEQPADADKLLDDSEDEFVWDPEIEGRYIPRYDPAYPGLRVPFTGTEHPNAALFRQRTTPVTTQVDHVSAYDDYAKTVSPRVRDFVEQNWDDDHDTNAAIEEEQLLFAEYKEQQQQQASLSSDNSNTAPSASAASFLSKDAFSKDFVTSDKVQQALNNGWTPADADDTIRDFDIEYEAFAATRSGQRSALGATA